MHTCNSENNPSFIKSSLLDRMVGSANEGFMRTEQIMCLNRGRSKGEDCGHVKSI